MTLLPTFIVITTAFFLAALAVHSFGRLKFCAVCVAISVTWLALLAARLMGYTVNPVLIGVLVGESIVGLYQMMEKRVPAGWQIFRWPYIITATVVAYLILGVRSGGRLAVVLLGLMWIGWGAILVMRHNPFIKKIAGRLIACCRDW